MVTPSRRPVAARSRISATSAVSTKNFMALFRVDLHCGEILFALPSSSNESLPTAHFLAPARRLRSRPPALSPTGGGPRALAHLPMTVASPPRARAGGGGRPLHLRLGPRTSARHDRRSAARHAARARRGLERAARRGGAEEAARDRGDLRRAAASRGADPLRRLGGRLHADPARHGASHGAALAAGARAGKADRSACASPARRRSG